MSDLIKNARPKPKARFVCMEGADKLVSLISEAKILVTKPADTDGQTAQRILRYLSKA